MTQVDNQPPLTVQLAGSWTLKKCLLHYTYFQMAATHLGPGGYPLLPYAQYVIEWFPAGGDQKRIFSARYRVPFTAQTFKPAGGTNEAFYTLYSAGDREIGFNQKYSHPQFEPSQIGVVQLSYSIQLPGTLSDMHEGWWEGVFSVLGQRS